MLFPHVKFHAASLMCGDRWQWNNLALLLIVRASGMMLREELAKNGVELEGSLPEVGVAKSGRPLESRC